MLLLFYIVLSHIYLTNVKIKYDDLKIEYDNLVIKFDSKQMLYNIINPVVKGMIAGFYRNSNKYKK